MCDPERIRRVVAIDGPAGAGKSTVAAGVAIELGFAFMDTGAMYRAATWRAMHHGMDLMDGNALVASTQAMTLEFRETPEGQRVLVDGEDVTEAIRTQEVTRNIYLIDQNPGVRARLVELQRAFALEKGPTVAEGRDMGTVVFPAAACKFFLDASIEERTRRRAEQLESKGVLVDREALRAEILERDEKSRTRAVAPLRMADDAVLVDTTDRGVRQVIDTIASLARKAL